MPYHSANDLPDNVRNVLPKHAQEIYLAAFNNAWDEYKDPDERRGDASREEKLAAKAATFQALKDEYQLLKANWGGYAGYDRWFAEPLSNAHLAAIATYHDFVPGFRALLAREGDFGKFYQAVRALSSLDEVQRHQVLAAAAEPAPMAARH